MRSLQSIRSPRHMLTAAALLTASCLFSACSSAAPATSGSSSGAHRHLSIAFFAFSTTNNYTDAEYTGMKQEAKKLGGVTLHVISANGDATTQFNQVQTASVTKQYDGAVIDPIDNVGIAAAARQLITAGTAVATVSNEIGPDPTSLKPQVPGMLGAITAPNHDTELMAKQVVNYCADKNPCRVIMLIASLSYPFDKVRYDSMLSVLKPHKNIHVIGLGQAQYSKATAVTVMTDLLQAHPKFDVLLSDADQETEGAQIALQNAGWNLKKMISSGKLYITSLGGDQPAIKAVRQGIWSSDVGNFPVTAGALTLEELVHKLRGQPYQPPMINVDKETPVPLVMTKSVLAAHPSFIGQWND